jgi:hypothetical protein
MKDIDRRLATAADIKKEPWWDGVDFMEILKKSIEAPIKPEIKGQDDVSNFDQKTREGMSPVNLWTPDLGALGDETYQDFEDFYFAKKKSIMDEPLPRCDSMDDPINPEPKTE